MVILAVGLFSFAALTALVHLRALSALDLAATRYAQVFASGPLDVLSAIFNVLFSAEVSMVVGVAATVYLWRREFGVWSLAPLAFLPLVGIEFLLKSVILQPSVPSELHRYTYYPLVSIQLAGSFPSGHAIRTAFFCLFAALLTASRRPALARLASSIFILLIAVSAFTRVYLGHHWLSDVVGGVMLGVAVAPVLASGVQGQARQISALRRNRTKVD